MIVYAANTYIPKLPDLEYFMCGDMSCPLDNVLSWEPASEP